MVKDIFAKLTGMRTDACAYPASESTHGGSNGNPKHKISPLNIVSVLVFIERNLSHIVLLSHAHMHAEVKTLTHHQSLAQHGSYLCPANAHGSDNCAKQTWES